MEATASYNGTSFTAAIQLQRPALGIVGNILYVPYGSFADHCDYRGWLVGVPINNPASVTAWATGIRGGAIWAVGGVASDGMNPFVTTGNTFQAANWSGGEAVIRFEPGPIFSNDPSDYWVPTNWQSLDTGDRDLGGSGPLLVDVPGATPSSLVVALGKDGNAYLVNRGNLSGIAPPVASLHLTNSFIINAAASYRTKQGTYVAYRVNGSNLAAFRINPANPPTMTSVWNVSQSGVGSPFVTSTDGTSNVIVWAVGSGGDQRLHGYDGDTGNVIFGGGGANDTVGGTHSYSTTGIVARGRLYVAGDNRVYAFNLPAGTPTPTPTASASTATTTPTATATCGTATATAIVQCDTNCDGHGNFDGERDTDCDSQRNSDARNCHGHANCDSDANCHSLRVRQSDTDTQTNAHSETPYDTEAAPDSAAKAVGRANNWERSPRRPGFGVAPKRTSSVLHGWVDRIRKRSSRLAKAFGVASTRDARAPQNNAHRRKTRAEY